MAVLLLPILASSCSPGTDGRGDGPTLEEVREATEKYRDVAVAVADGYVRDPMDICETPYHMGIVADLDDLGVMGIHYFRSDLLGIGEEEGRLDVRGTHTDFLRPAVLVYEPQEGGALELVALENRVSASAWEAEGHSEAPAFQSAAFEYHPDDPSNMMQAQYDMHVWLFRDNPSGMFAPYNPSVSCEHHVFNMPMIMRPGMTH